MGIAEDHITSAGARSSSRLQGFPGTILELMDDGWTVVTADRGSAAHFEHTVVTTPDSHVF